MKRLYVWMNRVLPTSLKNLIGRSSIFRPLRDFILRSNGYFKTEFADIKRHYPPFEVSFRFYASLKYALNAKDKGVETSLLKQSIQLLETKENRHEQVVLDVGANFGYLSMVWAQTVSQQGQVYSFEANPDVCQAFQKAITYNKFQNIKLVPKAVGNQNGTIRMFHMDTTSNVHAAEGSHDSFSIEMLRLDTFMTSERLTACDLVKIDVDGIEYDILQGSVDLIERFYPIFVVETNGDHRIPEFFHERGYTLYDLHMHAFEIGSLELPNNIFCLPPR